MKNRLLELLGLMIMGDGIASALEPRRHCLLWETGPEPCRELLDKFVQHPNMTRGFGILEAVVGFWIASRQMPEGGFFSRFSRRNQLAG